MEKATTNIKNEKIRTYFDDVTEGKKPAVQLTAEEYEQGINEFDDGMRKIIAEADEMIFRAKLGEPPFYNGIFTDFAPTLHRLWYGGSTEEERSYSDAKSKVLPECLFLQK